MKNPIAAALGSLATMVGIGAGQNAPSEAELAAKWNGRSFYTLKTTALDGSAADLAAYAGKVTLVVNVASKCGYTPQYKGLEALWRKYRDKGLVIIGFPSNEFGMQEPGSAEEIREFCSQNFGVSFPLMSKVETQAGKGQSEIYEYLGTRTGMLPSWNFGKYLIGRDGQPIAFYKSGVAPESDELVTAIEKVLNAGATPADKGAGGSSGTP